MYTVHNLLEAVKTVTMRSNKYQGKKVRRLHHLYDWGNFFSKAHAGLGGYATGGFNDEGHHDFQIKLGSDQKAYLNLKKYASTIDFEDPPQIDGFLVFKEGGFDSLAPHPPDFPVKGDDAWDRNDFSGTCRAFETYMGLDLSATATYREQWTETLNNTAADMKSLKEENKIKFLEPDMSGKLLQATPLAQQAFQSIEATASNPPFCTVFGGGRSKAQVKRDQEAFLVKSRGRVPVPTTPMSTISLLRTDFLLVERPLIELPVLVSITKRIQTQLPPESRQVEVQVCKYESSTEGEKGVFGPYKRTTGEGSTFIVSRAEILVYIVQWHKPQRKLPERLNR